MRIGLIGAAALSGEHYDNLIVARRQGRIDEIVLADDNPRLRPVDTPEFAHVSETPRGFPFSVRIDRTMQMFHQIHRNATGEYPRFHDDWRAMLESEALDGVIVGVPNWLHVEVATATLERRIPTLCEKPLATTLAGVDTILDAARRNDTLLQIGYSLRWRRLYEFLRERIAAGDIGTPRMGWGREFRGDWKRRPMTMDVEGAPQGNWRLSQRHMGSSILEKLSHDIDALMWLVDSEPVQATAYGGIGFYDDERETIDHAVFLLRFANDVKVSYEYCMAAPYAGRFPGRWMGLVGTEGMLDLDDHAGEILHYSRAEHRRRTSYRDLDPPTKPGHHRGNNTVRALDDFLDRIARGETRGRFDPADARPATWACLALEESIRQGGRTIDRDAFEPE